MSADVGKIIEMIARFIPLAWELAQIFGGDTREARSALRRLELEERAKRDERMGRDET